jgi:hypothetical protein
VWFIGHERRSRLATDSQYNLQLVASRLYGWLPCPGFILDNRFCRDFPLQPIVFSCRLGLGGRRRGTEYAHTSRDFLDRQASIRVICHNGRAWRGRGFRFFRILNESQAAAFRDRPQPSGSIALATAQNNAHNPRAVGFGSGNE